MPCTTKKLGDVTTIVCTRGHRQRCVHCGGPASALCDFPVTRKGRPGTCDAALCRHCTRPIRGARDLCRPHVGQWDFEADRPKVGPGAAPSTGDAA